VHKQTQVRQLVNFSVEITAHTAPSVRIQKRSALTFILLLFLQPSRSTQRRPWIVAPLSVSWSLKRP